MQEIKKIESVNSKFLHETTSGFHIPIGKVDRAIIVKRGNPCYKEIGKKIFPKRLRIVQSQSNSRKILMDRIKSVRFSYEKAKQRQDIFESPKKVFLYNDKELEAIVLEASKVIPDKDEKKEKEIVKRKLMNLILGITESDLIEVARKV